ncbi:MAG: transposase, partial [bacterium]|nr:transposase [bacterium]
DRGYDSKAVRALCEAVGITDVICAKKRPRGQANHTKLSTPLGMRWTVERTNSWLSNYGQLRRNTDRRTHHRLAQLALAIVFIITIKLINWRNRWNPTN